MHGILHSHDIVARASRSTRQPARWRHDTLFNHIYPHQTRIVYKIGVWTKSLILKCMYVSPRISPIVRRFESKIQNFDDSADARRDGTPHRVVATIRHDADDSRAQRVCVRVSSGARRRAQTRDGHAETRGGQRRAQQRLE